MAFTAIRKRKSRIFEREKCKNTQKIYIYIYITIYIYIYKYIYHSVDVTYFWTSRSARKNRSMYTRAIMALDLYPKTVTRNRQSQGGEKVVKN